MRADISRLPFVSGSIDAVHAGAAILCWPSPACAVSFLLEIFCCCQTLSGYSYLCMQNTLVPSTCLNFAEVNVLLRLDHVFIVMP